MSEEIPFGRIAVSKGLISQDQLEAALLDQARGRERGVSRRLGSILVEKGSLNPEDVRAILSSQGKSLHRCPTCRISYTLRGDDSGGLTCPECASVLTPAPAGDIGDGAPDVREEEGTLYVIEDDPTSLPPLPKRGGSRESSLGEAKTMVPSGATSTGTLGGALPKGALPLPRVRKPASQDLEIGDVVGGCEIIRLLGRGGMGTVYEAMHIALNKRVALKILSSRLTDHPVLIRRFLQEARTAAKLDHPHVVQVLNVGQDGPHRYIVMQYVEGNSLGQLLDRAGKLSLRRSLEIGMQVAEALAAAHAMGIVHRDVKPGNVMIQPDGNAKIADFGLAKEIDADKSLSKAGQVLGSPHYLSPEQADGRDVDLRTDIYSLGITLYHCISGKRPFTARSPVGVIVKHLKDAPPDIRKVAPDIPPVVATLILRMMAKRPKDRYKDCREVRNAIHAILHPGAPALVTTERSVPLWKPAFLAVAILLFLGAGLVAAGLGFGWIELPLGPAAGNDRKRDPAAEEYKAARLLLQADPPDTDGALKGFRFLVRTCGNDSKWGVLARLEIDKILKARYTEALKKLEQVREATERALNAKNFEAALRALENLWPDLTQTPAEEGAVLHERSVRRRVRLGRIEVEAERLAEKNRFDDILDRYGELEGSLPEEDRPFVEEAVERWRRRKAVWEKSGEEALARLLDEFGDPPKAPREAVEALHEFERRWAGSGAAKSAEEARQALEEKILSSGHAGKDYEAADGFTAVNPRDYDTAIKRFRELATRYPDDRWGALASERATRLEAEREEEAGKALASLRARVEGLPPEKALKEYRTFPPGLAGSRVYREELKPKLDRLEASVRERGTGARSALEEAEALLASSDRPLRAGRFRRVIEAFQRVGERYPDTPEETLAASRIERLRSDRRLEANKAFEKSMGAARAWAEKKNWEEARKALEEGFLEVYEDSPLCEKALVELGRFHGAQIAARFRGREEEALSQIIAFEKKHPQDLRGVLSRYEELLPRITESDLRNRIRKRVLALEKKFEAMAGKALREVRKQAKAEEDAGRPAGAIRLFRAFPEAYRGTTAFEEAQAEARRREALVEEMIRGAEDILRRNPDAFAPALGELDGVVKKYPKTRWSRLARNKMSEIQARAEWVAGRKMREAENLFGRGRYEEARGIYLAVAGWDVEKISGNAGARARLCDVRIERKRILGWITRGDYARAVREAERFLKDPKYRGLAEALEPLANHARNRLEGFVYVPGGAFRIRGQRKMMRPFYIRQTEVTNRAFRRFLDACGYGKNAYWDVKEAERAEFTDRTGFPGPRHWRNGAFPAGLGSHPVRYISWHEARAYARWKGSDLPTEDQWIVAAGWDRARSRMRLWPWGEDFDPERCWAGRSHDFAATLPVGRFPDGASPIGCHDMAGNVAEWVLDWYGNAKRYRVLKGGDSSDFDVPDRTRVLSRERAAPLSTHPLAGFRIVRPGKIIEGLD